MNLAITVHGKVQGVFFRASTHDKAIELNLTGFVRNELDGSVYIEAGGDEKALDQFVAWCKQGPKSATVEHVEVIEAKAHVYSTFEIRCR